MNAEFITTSDQRWSQMLDSCVHDVYHLPEYSEVAAHYEGGIPKAFYAAEEHEQYLLPVLLRKLPLDLDPGGQAYDIGSAYGYPGPLMVGERPSLLRLFGAFQVAAAKAGVVSAFIRMHPLLNINAAELTQYGQVVEHGQTVVLDLTQSESQVERNTRKSHRYEIRRLRSLGYSVSIDDWSLLPQAASVYRDTMQRVAASAFYYFPDSYFYELHHKLRPYLHLCCVLSLTGSVAAVGFFTFVSGILEFHLSGTDEEFRKMAPAKLMLDQMWRWGKERGGHVFHMGGGVGSQADSLFQFKAGFSSGRARFCTFRFIIDEKRYRELVERHFGMPVDYSPSGFFPAYRASIDVEVTRNSFSPPPLQTTAP